jgi:uncharacterized protein YjbI with pentapeptide repeats
MVPEHPHFFAHFRCWDLTFKSVPNYLKPAPSIVFSLVNFDGAVVNCYNRTGDRVLLADLLTRKCRRNLNGAMLPGMSAIALTWSKFFANIDSVQSGKEEEAQANLTAARLNHADLTTDTILADAKLTHADLSACHFGTRFAAIRASRKSSPR